MAAAIISGIAGAFTILEPELEKAYNALEPEIAAAVKQLNASGSTMAGAVQPIGNNT